MWSHGVGHDWQIFTFIGINNVTLTVFKKQNWFISTLGRRQWHLTPVLLPGKSHGRRNLVGCSPWGHEELDTTERLHFHFSFSCIGEGNGNPLQCSCLENPRDGEAWWAAVCGVAKSWTCLKRLSSSREVGGEDACALGKLTKYCSENDKTLLSA